MEHLSCCPLYLFDWVWGWCVLHCDLGGLAESYFLPDLGAGSVGSGYQQGWFLLGLQVATILLCPHMVFPVALHP
jgi:hypothetical protein